MCFHLYTSHACGHRSVYMEQCSGVSMPTAVLFCDGYHTRKASSFRLCGGDHCKEDKETANWVENGSAMLKACEDELSDLKCQIQHCYGELKALHEYRTSWGPLQGDMIEKAQSLHEQYQQMVQKFDATKDRRRFIMAGIDTTKQKLEKIKQRIALVLKQYQTARAADMRAMQQPVAANITQPLVGASLNAPPTLNQGLSAVLPSQTPQTGLMQRSKVANAGYPAIVNPPQSSAASLRARDSIPLHTTPSLSARSALNPSTSKHQAQSAEAKISPPKKRRGRPPKAKKAETPTPPAQESPVNTDSEIVEPPSKRHRPQRGSDKEAEIQNLPSSGTRRSGRINSKKRVSYAESSPSPSPEPSPSNSVMYKPAPIDTSQAAPKPAGRSTRVRKAAAKLNQMIQEEDEDYVSDGNGVDSDDAEGGDDGEWQQQENEADKDEFLGNDITPVRNTRLSKKRAAATSLKNSRSSKRQATDTNVESAHQKQQDLGDAENSFSLPDLDAAFAYTTTPTNWNTAQALPSWPNMQIGIDQPHALPAHLNVVMAPQISLRGGHGDHSTANSNSFLKSTPDSSYVTNQYAQGQNNLGGLDVSPLSRSDMMNGVSMADDMMFPVDSLDDDDNIYDFDVNEISKVVASLDAQQGAGIDT